MAAVMGTAGHVDHGKTALVRALTGIDCDRLEEEKRRGITIELGFAHSALEDGSVLGIVDVPGHERFVRNMVAGAAGIDFVMLVIAADEGVMPQTREHVEICSLLGIRTGLVALTKTDLVDEAWLHLVLDDVRAALTGTFLENAPVFPVSSLTGEGLSALKEHIAVLAAKFTPSRRTHLFRLPIDRAFTLKGHGTVVTGTLSSGSLLAGEELEVFPSRRLTKARGLHCHGTPVEEASGGSRVAVNLSGLEVEDVHRGDTLARPGTLFPATRWLLRLSCLKSSPRPIRHRGELHFHHNARECTARIHLFGRERLAPGETALAEARFEQPMVGVFGDHFILRGYVPLRTIAGGMVLHPLGMVIRRKDMTPAREQAFLALPEADETSRLLVQIETAGYSGITGERLEVLTGLDAKRREKILHAHAGKEVFCFDKEGQGWISARTLATLEEQCQTQAALFHTKNPLRPGMTRSAAAAGWGDALPPRLVHVVLERLLRAGKLVAEGDVIRLASHRLSLASDLERLKETLLAIHRDAGLTPPSVREAMQALASPPPAKAINDVLRLLVNEGQLVKLKEGLYAAAPAVDGLKRRIREWFATQGNLDLAALRELSGGLSRKYLIAYLEYFDRERFTLRVGDVRRLRD